jgi:hypothetical protein
MKKGPIPLHGPSNCSFLRRFIPFLGQKIEKKASFCLFFRIFGQKEPFFGLFRPILGFLSQNMGTPHKKTRFLENMKGVLGGNRNFIIEFSIIL